jgi:hypothetical protein
MASEQAGNFERIDRCSMRVSRRHALRVGGTGLICGLSLPRLLELQAVAATGREPRAKACIFLFLEGGPSTIDMWDLKPEAPSEIRGPYKQIQTKVPGTLIGELCQESAKVADKFALLRGHSHADNGHTTGYHLVMTGRKADFADGQNPVPNNLLFPSLGSIVSREFGLRGSVPPYINMPQPMASGGPGFYGAEHAPFVIENDPVQADFEVKDLRLLDGVSQQRLDLRQKLRQAVDAQASGPPAPGRSQALASYYEKAYDLITSPAAQKAFDISREPKTVREAYGQTSIGQCALLSRRLVEAGCRFVGVDSKGWDMHFTCFPSLNDMVPKADRAFAALVSDLDQRGMLDSTLVVMMGEMGRTPRITAQAGRDHWSQAQTVVIAGGGVKRGLLLGSTDKHASMPASEPVSVNDLLFTIFHLLGIDTTKTYYTPLGRPVPILAGGQLIPGLT